MNYFSVFIKQEKYELRVNGIQRKAPRQTVTNFPSVETFVNSELSR